METFYFFYSAKQKAIMQSAQAKKLCPKPHTYVVDGQGNIHEYTSMFTSREPALNFDDIVFLCEGTKACIIYNGVPQGHWAKEHMYKFNAGKFSTNGKVKE